MRKLVVVFSALAFAGLAQAGEYHRLAQLRCSDCHTMHFSRAHNFTSNDADAGFVTSATPNDSLLLAGGVNTTCLACHDNNDVAPNVLEANDSTYVAAGTRSAGFLNEEGSGTEFEGHTLDHVGRPPGLPTAATWNNLAVECENCHAVHGSRAYRNLGLGRVAVSQGFSSSAFGNVGPTYTFTATAGAVDPNYDVTIESNAGGGPLNGTSANTYETAKIKFGKGAGNATEPYFTGSAYLAQGASQKVPVVNGMNEYCAKCHGDFHGATNTLGGIVGTTQHYIRHPTTGVARAANTLFQAGAFTGVVGLDPAQAMDSADGAIVRAVFTNSDKGTWEVGCLTCHKGHGNGRPFGLILPDHQGTIADYENGDAAALPDGSYSVRNLCVTCHGMGRSF